MLGLITDKACRVKRTPPRSPRRSGVCRKLTFGSSSPLRRQDTHGVYQREMASMLLNNTNKWNYDFLQEVQLEGPYQYKLVATTPEKQQPPRRNISAAKRKSPGKVKRRSPAKAPGCTSCAGSRAGTTSNRSSPINKRTINMDTKSDISRLSRVPRVDSPLLDPACRSVVMPCETCHSENVCPVRRVRAAGVVRNLAALYWADANNNTPIKNNNSNNTSNNNNIINKNISITNSNNNSNIINNNSISDIKMQTNFQCSPLRVDYLDPSEDCENSPSPRLHPGGPHPGGCRALSTTCRVTPERGLRLGSRRKQSQITDFFCQQKALRLQEKHQKHHYYLRHPYHPPQQQS